MIDEFNADHPTARIKPKDEAQWRKEARRTGAQRDSDTGIQVNPRKPYQAELTRFAQ